MGNLYVNGVPANFNLWGERRHKLPVYLAERYKPLHTYCRTRSLTYWITVKIPFAAKKRK